jgi:hypothetical protein
MVRVVMSTGPAAHVSSGPPKSKSPYLGAALRTETQYVYTHQ